MRTLLEDAAGETNGIFDAMKAGDGAGFQGGGLHDDGVAFDLAIEIEMRTVARVEDGIVFENGDRSFNRVEGVTAVAKHGPTSVKRAKAAFFAGVNGVVGDVPGTTVDDEGRAHERKKKDSR